MAPSGVRQSLSRCLYQRLRLPRRYDTSVFAPRNDGSLSLSTGLVNRVQKQLIPVTKTAAGRADIVKQFTMSTTARTFETA